MVRVTWSQRTGKVRNVRRGDGPGEFTDDVDSEEIENFLKGVDSVDEETIVGAVIANYDGPLQEYECHVTADTYNEEPDQDDSGVVLQSNSLVTTIAFVELDEGEDKLSIMYCEDCGFNPSAANDWTFRIREKENWVYHDWLCPECEHTVHTELVEMPTDGVESKAHPKLDE